MKRVVAFLLLSVFTVIGCSTETVPTRTGQMVPLSVGKDKNPDVIWVVRSIDVEDGEDVKTFWGLFACYRKKTPGAPVCYLAEIKAKLKNLSWPGNVVMEEGDIISK